MSFEKDRVTRMKGHLLYKPRHSRLNLKRKEKLMDFKTFLLTLLSIFTAKRSFFFLKSLHATKSN